MITASSCNMKSFNRSCRPRRNDCLNFGLTHSSHFEASQCLVCHDAPGISKRIHGRYRQEYIQVLLRVSDVQSITWPSLNVGVLGEK